MRTCRLAPLNERPCCLHDPSRLSSCVLLLTQSTQSLAAWGSPHHSEPPMRGADARWAEPALEALRRPLLSCSSTHVAVRERENELRSRDATVWTAMAPSAATCHASEAAVNAWTRDGSISMHEPIIAPWLRARCR
jgi:hypothetical protein